MNIRRIRVARTPDPWPGLTIMCEQQAQIDEEQRCHDEAADLAITRDMDVDRALELNQR